MSDTPIAERLAAELGMPLPPPWQRMRGSIFDYFVDQRHGPRDDGQAEARQDAAPPGPAGAASTQHQEAIVANPNCPTCKGSGTKSQVEKSKDAQGNDTEWWRQVPCGC